ncbi:2-amino-3,7-dideoxy-D-threo-hept-6-ulosonate synthase [Streptomyces sp. CNQ085]|uniref:2-amino-3,7-dideoxy-D-threo-hept-6-ulosonate synthase n=1 Tax=Streptomyces sp. CNQ085 TaxID=2886944 RepID=UPI001F514435|nr:2-amino-3,7-dideoxy-D-threo-hept-6-ulosonate synthase [Streptomyces sp. CNQ085]MCI0386310.1 fructose-bisphosphate aldolase [Streptomyces sp. CNQ085]
MSRWSPGKSLRISRLGPPDGRFLFVPMDHSLADGPIVCERRFHELVQQVSAGGADAVVLHKGRARGLDPRVLQDTALVVHLSGSTSHAPDADAKILVGSVEDALTLGADAVSVHVNVGSDTEAEQLADLGAVAGACDRWGLPLFAMIYPRGPRISNPHDPSLLAHVVNIAADLGADLVKTTWSAPLGAMADVVSSSPVPVLVAGGPADGGDLAVYAREALAAGCSGLAVGRRVFGHSDPRAAVQELAAIVHPTPSHTGRGPAEFPSRPSPSRVLAGSR